MSVASGLAGQRGASRGPPMPFEDVGACPFEGCVYREWVANATVTLLRDRRVGAPASVTLHQGDHVQAITGIVVTLKPGRVQFRKAVTLRTTTDSIHVEPGDTLYLLTYRGEGVTAAWFKGRFYDDLDGAEFFDASCSMKPGRCNGTILEKPTTEWWVRIRAKNGVIGWTNQPRRFDNRDALGG